ncbi:MAG: TMAO reductase system periplasmic protein TorT [Gemmatimonadetes bacterium]|jgi:periplasmic protein TorT|nr:TMAO reductase system periplasmic protein TorT [Gemmatimonadota bacterium]MBT6145643.1 TMAO reductase system periplasmic protein TorT [Gemmatimonadota bacterium]MBT7860154.1 TMAO reductase system periplasmic protein TorT [Gemmatimonadota bacterium]
MAVRRWVVVSILLMHTFAGAQDWFPFPVEVWDPPFDVSSPRKQQDYVPLGEATGDWRIGVSFPHMKDAYWLAVNYGIVDEARRLGVGLDLVQAGGYEHLDRQIEQIREQAASGIDGVVIASISLSGMDTLVADLARAGIPVIDAVNGMNSDHLAAKSLVSFGEMGGLAGSYLAERHQGPGDTARVAWFPGPEAAGWVQDGNEGFMKAVEAAAIEVVATRYGDTGRKAQEALLNEVLDADEDLDYIVGTAVTAEAAVTILRNRGLSDRVQVISYYLTPGVYRGIRRGRILASPTDSAVIQGRIAVDQLVRVLEGKPVLRHVGPRLRIIDQQNIGSFDRGTSLAPSGFRPTYTIN